MLVVEDEPHIRELVCLHLGLEGYQCDAVGDGPTALERAAATRFDLLVLDLMLPGLDGLALCRAVRNGRTNRDVPILMITGRAEPVDRVRGFDAGVDEYLARHRERLSERDRKILQEWSDSYCSLFEVQRVEKGVGVELKDPFSGLVDFPAWRHGHEVYLCWRLGEPDVAHWHELDAGFAGRRPLDAPSPPGPLSHKGERGGKTSVADGTP